MKVGQDASADEQWGLHALAAKMIALEIFTHQLYAITYRYVINIARIANAVQCHY